MGMSSTGQGASWRIFQAVLPRVGRIRSVLVVPCVLMTMRSASAWLANAAMLSAGVPGDITARAPAAAVVVARPAFRVAEEASAAAGEAASAGVVEAAGAARVARGALL